MKFTNNLKYKLGSGAYSKDHKEKIRKIQIIKETIPLIKKLFEEIR